MALEHILDGRLALEQTIGRENLLPTVARFTVFLHPKTVAQTDGRAVFQVVRWARSEKRGSITRVNGERVVACDNTTPTDATVQATSQRLIRPRSRGSSRPPHLRAPP